MNRTPPKAVRQALRREVGFGCPVLECGNPYLEWHHFDPPWHVEEHHNPEGMIALCAEHHRKADAGAYTREQLRKLKSVAHGHAAEVAGRFDWLRNRLLAVVGGNFYYETPVIFTFRDHPVIWFNRDVDGHLLLNLGMLSTVKEERLHLDDNFWIAKGNLSDFECPPSGKLLRAEYPNGDMVRIQYFELSSSEEIKRRYPDAHTDAWKVELPITAVEIHFRVGGTELEFGPRWTRLPGNDIIRNCFMSHCGAGIALS